MEHLFEGKTRKVRWQTSLFDFVASMERKIYDNLKEKGVSWRTMSNEELLDLIQKYVERRDFVSVANIAFMLWENRKEKKQR